MTIHVNNDDGPSPISPLVADEFVVALDARLQQHIIITGRGQIELMVAFIRHGFSNVTCQSPSSGPRLPREASDILIIPHLQGALDLVQILRRLSHALRRQGVLAIYEGADFAVRRDLSLRQELLQAGFDIRDQISLPTGGGKLWRACSRAEAVALAA